MRNFTVEAPPTVNLNWPANNYRTTASTLNFTYTPNDPIGITQCDLYIDGVFNDSTVSVNPNQQNNFTVSGIAEGHHNWTVNCSDPDSNWAWDEEYSNQGKNCQANDDKKNDRVSEPDHFARGWVAGPI